MATEQSSRVVGFKLNPEAPTFTPSTERDAPAATETLDTTMPKHGRRCRCKRHRKRREAIRRAQQKILAQINLDQTPMDSHTQQSTLGQVEVNKGSMESSEILASRCFCFPHFETSPESPSTMAGQSDPSDSFLSQRYQCHVCFPYPQSLKMNFGQDASPPQTPDPAPSPAKIQDIFTLQFNEAQKLPSSLQHLPISEYQEWTQEVDESGNVLDEYPIIRNTDGGRG
ncbi:hypothetical protein DFH27DRAFT_609658 [Peziza echinospora]|nr:hypothetical protein DFH27DRAFT_609658 [Peziza echinospora]